MLSLKRSCKDYIITDSRNTGKYICKSKEQGRMHRYHYDLLLWFISLSTQQTRVYPIFFLCVVIGNVGVVLEWRDFQKTCKNKPREYSRIGASKKGWIGEQGVWHHTYTRHRKWFWEENSLLPEIKWNTIGLVNKPISVMVKLIIC